MSFIKASGALRVVCLSSFPTVGFEPSFGKNPDYLVSRGIGITLCVWVGAHASTRYGVAEKSARRFSSLIFVDLNLDLRDLTTGCARGDDSYSQSFVGNQTLTRWCGPFPRSSYNVQMAR